MPDGVGCLLRFILLMVLLRRGLIIGEGSSIPADQLFGFVNGKLGAPPQQMYVETSADGGRSFTEGNGGSPVIPVGSGGSWYDEYIAQGSLVQEGSVYALYVAGYDGSAWRIGRWTSSILSDSPSDWTADPANPIINLGTAGQPDHDGANIPHVQYDASASLTRIWYTGFLGSTTTVCYAERSSSGTITKYGKVLDVGTAGSFEDAGTVSGPVLEHAGVKRIYYAGYDGADYSSAYATYTDPRVAATYTKQGVIAELNSGVTLDGPYDSVGPYTILPRASGGYIFLLIAARPTGSANQREVTAWCTSNDGLTFSPMIGPVVPMSTNWPAVESRENATMVIVP